MDPLNEEAKAIIDAIAGFGVAAFTLSTMDERGTTEDIKLADREHDRAAKHLFSLVFRRPPTDEELKRITRVSS